MERMRQSGCSGAGGSARWGKGFGREATLRLTCAHTIDLRGKGPVEHVLPTPGRGERGHSGGSEEGGQGPSEGRDAEGGGAQAETQLRSQPRRRVREPQAAGKEGPGDQGTQPPPQPQSALAFYSLSRLKGPLPCAPSKPVSRRELIPPGGQACCFPGALCQGLRPALQPRSPRKLSSLSLTPQSSAELSFSCLLPPRLLLTLL